MAGLWATLNADGTFAESTSSTSLKNAHEDKGGTNIDSEAFLTLLVAEMQNQDPLEPTSNTEWISQYATFTEVSTIQEIGDSMSSVQAQGLAGKNVIMRVTDEKGQTNYVEGLVDRVAYEAGKAYLYINGNPYSIDDLDTVVSDEYLDATEKIADLKERIEKLPEVRDITAADEEEIMALGKIMDSLTEYEKQFLEGDEYDTMTEYLTELNAVMEHHNAVERSEVIENAVANLPALDKIDSWSDDQLKYAQAFVDAYNDLTQAEKGYVSDSTTQIVGQYKNALETLKDRTQAADNNTVSEAEAMLQQAREALDAAEKAKEEAEAARRAAEEAAKEQEQKTEESGAAQESGTGESGETGTEGSESGIAPAGDTEDSSGTTESAATQGTQDTSSGSDEGSDTTETSENNDSNDGI